jgi:hypothetical protein
MMVSSLSFVARFGRMGHYRRVLWRTDWKETPVK